MSKNCKSFLLECFKVLYNILVLVSTGGVQHRLKELHMSYMRIYSMLRMLVNTCQASMCVTDTSSSCIINLIRSVVMVT